MGGHDWPVTYESVERSGLLCMCVVCVCARTRAYRRLFVFVDATSERSRLASKIVAVLVVRKGCYREEEEGAFVGGRAEGREGVRGGSGTRQRRESGGA
jgi:hypothetical protein